MGQGKGLNLGRGSGTTDPRATWEVQSTGLEHLLDVGIQGRRLRDSRTMGQETGKEGAYVLVGIPQRQLEMTQLKDKGS